MSEDENTGLDLVRIFPDQPVTEAEGLDFQFEGLARTLAELAWNPDNATPFTAVVRGGWGRGKTTLLRQTERLLGGASRVIRGGSWGQEARFCRSAYRNGALPDIRSNDIGFRCVRVPE